jgi:hypothetical protein
LSQRDNCYQHGAPVGRDSVKPPFRAQRGEQSEHTHRSAEIRLRAFSSHHHRAKLELCAPVHGEHSRNWCRCRMTLLTQKAPTHRLTLCRRRVYTRLLVSSANLDTSHL